MARLGVERIAGHYGLLLCESAWGYLISNGLHTNGTPGLRLTTINYD
eukprot:CAMPEP_0196655438 /NCGR_PEP_ID=MMETSP1086-20130531/5189_1 /TAXON_ID=77921 /ORGANISM="Cyanoptyche  gloeocystis , Strain SAG4.97" /LENGTH=46 /DNA_ID= /DNA_START= /DNA_END= /DNA_ORIENTATION=